VATYVLDGFANLDPRLAGLGRLSPFYYYRSGEPLLNGLQWGHAGVLLAMALVLASAAFPLLERRDLRQR